MVRGRRLASENYFFSPKRKRGESPCWRKLVACAEKKLPVRLVPRAGGDSVRTAQVIILIVHKKQKSPLLAQACSLCREKIACTASYLAP